MNNLAARIFSALIAVGICAFSAWLWGERGVLLLGAAICSIGIIEYSKIVIRPICGLVLYNLLFIAFAISLLLITTFSFSKSIFFWATLVPIFLSISVWALRNKFSNEKTLATLAMSVLGFIYCALLPAYALLLLSLPDGLAWFVLLLGLVFAGDTFAYFGGVLVGKTKIMPMLSPSKTLAGSIFGLIGSLLIGLLISRLWLSDIPLLHLVALAVVAAFCAQTGDLFESLLKRVGNVKDSGRIIPGHGGVLDRLDGVYFAAPLIYFYYYFFLP